MKPRFLTGLLSLLMPAMVLAGEYDLTVDRVKIDFLLSHPQVIDQNKQDVLSKIREALLRYN